MITFFDTETNGLPKNWKAPMSDRNNWPRVIQLAWEVTDMAGEPMNKREILIKPDGWVIPTDKFWKDHGFSTEKSMAEGTPLIDALQEFTVDLARSEYLVAHNMAFDYNVLGCEMLRSGVNGKRCVKICTMDSTIEFCKIPFAGRKQYPGAKPMQYKFPKLEELYNKLFGTDFDNKHRAGGDVAAMRACFFELVKRGIIELPKIAAE